MRHCSLSWEQALPFLSFVNGCTGFSLKLALHHKICIFPQAVRHHIIRKLLFVFRASPSGTDLQFSVTHLLVDRKLTDWANISALSTITTLLQEDVRDTSVRCNTSFAAVVKHTTTNDKEERIRDLFTAVGKTRSLSRRADQAGNQHIARTDGAISARTAVKTETVRSGRKQRRGEGRSTSMTDRFKPVTKQEKRRRKACHSFCNSSHTAQAAARTASSGRKVSNMRERLLTGDDERSRSSFSSL